VAWEIHTCDIKYYIIILSDFSHKQKQD